MHATAAAAVAAGFWSVPQVVDFLSTSLGMPDSYAFSKPQLAEFYVHHHFLHFTQHYHKLPTSPASGSAVLCKSHLQVSGCWWGSCLCTKLTALPDRGNSSAGRQDKNAVQHHFGNCACLMGCTGPL